MPMTNPEDRVDRRNALDRERIAELKQQELERLNDSTSGSAEVYLRANRVLSAGVASSYQMRDPWPLYLERGSGPKVWDVDQRELWDFHNGFGSMIQGHAHPAIVNAIKERSELGTHFATPTEDGIVVAEELARRFRLPKWRFTNSGSESTMDAIRIARGLTGRDTILKIFGYYHGHHDAVMVSIAVDTRSLSLPVSVPYGAGIPQSTVELTACVHFNDAESMERRIVELDAEGRKPACVIMEAAMLNLGIVLPEPGYLEAVREITRRHGVILIFDEVKSGLSMAPGGAVERFGVVPDMVTLAKALGGGLPSGAIGMSEQVSAVVESGDVYQVGTYNGNPVTMAAARASLLEVLTPDAYAHIDRLNDRILNGCQGVVDTYGLAAYTIGVGAKGCVTFADEKVTDYVVFKEHQDVELFELSWLFNVNRGIFMSPGRADEWTLSVTHTDEAVDRYVEVFEELAAAITD